MTASWRDEAEPFMAGMHDAICDYLEQLDGEGRFREDRWDRPGGGGGVARVLTDGALFEKAGVNRSAVHGEISAAGIARLGGRFPANRDGRFYATGVSLVLHPLNPHVPTVHLNVRYFELADPSGEVHDAWFGGGTDLTPFVPHRDDPVTFHAACRAACDAVDPGWYPRFKAWCDEYFRNTHRGGEARGVGGIFFDNLRPGDDGVPPREELAPFIRAVGTILPLAYGPIVERRRAAGWTAAQRHFQLLRRGRYVEFNLVHDRGTVFGLQTAARIESVLMSLPPLAAWDYAPEFAPGSEEADLMAMLVPRDWLADA